MPPHREVRAVDLQQEARPHDRLVLVPHRVGDGEEIGLVARVVIVPEEERDHARRGGRHEAIRAPRPGERRLEVLGVGLGRPRVAHGDRAVAGRRPAPRDARDRRRRAWPARGSRRGPGTGAAGWRRRSRSGDPSRRSRSSACSSRRRRSRPRPRPPVAHDLGHRGPGAGGEGGAVDGTPSSLANIARTRSSGRGRLPVCVVRNRSRLCLMRGPRRRRGSASRRAETVPGEGEPRAGPAAEAEH